METFPKPSSERVQILPINLLYIYTGVFHRQPRYVADSKDTEYFYNFYQPELEELPGGLHVIKNSLWLNKHADIVEVS